MGADLYRNVHEIKPIKVLLFIRAQGTIPNIMMIIIIPSSSYPFIAWKLNTLNS